MSPPPGTRLGSFEIASLIGSGGMGEVYRAKDLKLGREVAIKALPDLFSKDKERLSRFDREARLLASLNHPNIATIYGLEESDGEHYLVLELVEGETLSERIKRGPVPLEEVFPLFTQIAEALETAHVDPARNKLKLCSRSQKKRRSHYKSSTSPIGSKN